jgi:hypothetical protein
MDGRRVARRTSGAEYDAVPHRRFSFRSLVSVLKMVDSPKSQILIFPAVDGSVSALHALHITENWCWEHEKQNRAITLARSSGHTILIQQDVLGLDIAVRDPPLVHKLLQNCQAHRARVISARLTATLEITFVLVKGKRLSIPRH